MIGLCLIGFGSGAKDALGRRLSLLGLVGVSSFGSTKVIDFGMTFLEGGKLSLLCFVGGGVMKVTDFGIKSERLFVFASGVLIGVG